MYLQKLTPKPQVLGANLADEPLVAWSLNHYSSKNLRIDIVASGVTGTVTLQLQHRPLGGEYEDLASANSSVTLVDGNNTITMNVEIAADQADMPIRRSVRLVATTDGTGAASLDSVSCQVG